MKTIFKYVASLSVMLLAVSCALTEIDTQMTAEQAIAAIRLDCSAEQQYNIPADRAQVITFQVTSTTPWSISSPENPDWLTFSPVSSAVSSLKEDIRVSVTANPGFEDRIATLVVTGENTQKSHTITIKQLRNGRFEFTPAAGDIPASGSAVTFTVTTNLDWTVEAEDSWLVIDKASVAFLAAFAFGDGQVKVVVALRGLYIEEIGAFAGADGLGIHIFRGTLLTETSVVIVSVHRLFF